MIIETSAKLTQGVFAILPSDDGGYLTLRLFFLLSKNKSPYFARLAALDAGQLWFAEENRG